MQWYIKCLTAMLLVYGSLFAQSQNIQVGSITRSMIVYAPKDLSADRPLLLSLHGAGQGADYQKNQTKWEPIADTAKFLVVFPAGINLRWDISGNSDVLFLQAVIDTMANRYKIDRNRVYVSGFSMGGMMSYHTANNMADKIAAIAPVGGYLFSNVANSSRPIPIIHTHGTADDVVGYSGVANMLQAWRTKNGCPVTAQTTKPYPSTKPSSLTTLDYWGPCKENTAVALLTWAGKGHWHPMDVANGVNTSEEIWNFVKKYSLASSALSSSSAVSSSSVAVSSSSIASSSSSVPIVQPEVPSPRDSVYNGNFAQGTLGWTLNVWQGTAQGSIVQGEYHIQISAIGTVNYQIQLIQAGIILQQGQSYELSFDAYATAKRSLEVNVEKDTDPWTSYLSAVQQYDLSTQRTRYTLPFTMTQPTDSNGRISFNAGSSTESLFLDNVAIRVVEGQDEPSTSLPVRVSGVSLRVHHGRSLLVVEQSGSASPLVLSLVNLQGKVVRRLYSSSESAFLDLADLPQGLYFVKVHQGVRLVHSSRWLHAH